MLEKLKQRLQVVATRVKDTVSKVKSVVERVLATTVRKSKNVVKLVLKPLIVMSALIPGASFAAAIDLSTLVTKIDEQIPGLTSVGVSVTGLIIIVAIFGLAFLLLRSR